MKETHRHAVQAFLTDRKDTKRLYIEFMFLYISSRAALNDRDLDPGGCTPLYDPYGDVPLVRVCFLSSLP